MLLFLFVLQQCFGGCSVYHYFKKKKIPYHKTVTLVSWKEVCIFCLFRMWGIRRVLEGNVTCLTFLCVGQRLGRLFSLETCAFDVKTLSVVVKDYIFMLSS